ncbi:MAG: hypothetical protein ACRDTH_21915 [Pseudonocardiaceae bacterium]
MSGLHRQLQNYLAIRRAMGFKMERHTKLLGQFTDYLAAHDATTLTIEHALAWAGAPSAADPRWWAARLSMVRGFAVYLHALDPAHQVPPRGLMPGGSRRTVVPYLSIPTRRSPPCSMRPVRCRARCGPRPTRP